MSFFKQFLVKKFREKFIIHDSLETYLMFRQTVKKFGWFEERHSNSEKISDLRKVQR